ncbi:hypothetical protein JXA32_01390 [Candidatus Sumerlaeota bacterium]|nr:hypothetical protein [Candidatus Sumerlaeota bacterium]
MAPMLPHAETASGAQDTAHMDYRKNHLMGQAVFFLAPRFFGDLAKVFSDPIEIAIEKSDGNDDCDPDPDSE